MSNFTTNVLHCVFQFTDPKLLASCLCLSVCRKWNNMERRDVYWIDSANRICDAYISRFCHDFLCTYRGEYDSTVSNKSEGAWYRQFRDLYPVWQFLEHAWFVHKLRDGERSIQSDQCDAECKNSPRCNDHGTNCDSITMDYPLLGTGIRI